MAITKAAGENTLRKLIELIKSNFFCKSEGQTTGTIDIDTAPTDGSTNLVTSGGVKAYVDANSSSGSSDYSDLTNKPKIGGVELSGDKSASDLGLYTSAEAEELTQGVATTFMNYNQQNEDTFATKAQVGDNSDLSTAETTTIVGAINEVANCAAEANEMATGNVNEIGNIYETIEALKQEIPTKVGDLPNDMQYATEDYVNNLIVSTINSAY